jgi:hypothetical protein
MSKLDFFQVEKKQKNCKKENHQFLKKKKKEKEKEGQFT